MYSPRREPIPTMMSRKSNSKPFWGRWGRPSNFGDKHYFDYDDRMIRPPNDGSNFMNKQMPRVSFKKQHYRNNGNIVLKNLDEDVLVWPGFGNNTHQVVHRGRGRGFIRGRNSPLPQSDGQDRRLKQIPISKRNWYRISIPQGQKFTKEFVLQSLLSYTHPLIFIPFMYKVLGTYAVFYVEDHTIAMKIADCDQRFATSDGFKMQIRIKPSLPPVEINDELKERLKQVMSSRYFQETNALDLSKFYHDPGLIADYWCPLARPNMLMTVLDIVQEHIPNLEALNLDSNRLMSIEMLSLLAGKFKKLKILHIGDNKIKEIKYLNVLKNLQLEELRLEGNPFCNKYKNKQEEYVNDVRKTFPKLVKLDGVELPLPIGSHLEDHKVELPSTKNINIVQSNAKAQEVASQFVHQYFVVFDSDSRQPLLAAYHEHAHFSMTVNIPESSSKFNEHFLENRNLCTAVDSNRRCKLLEKKVPVVSFITEMPRTKHDLASFTMELGLVTDGMMQIIVRGLFQEFNSKENKEYLRFFDRTFTIVPEGAGFCIKKEELHISNPTMIQKGKFGSTSSAVQPTPGLSTVPTSVSAVPLTEEIKQQMAMTLSHQTNMNIEWSLKCLEEVQWNFENACAAFQEAFSLGKIPPIAFTK